ncbi:MAG: hypothetical protein Q8L77_09220 [Nitrospirota bacterium]|nr:hypothetical protein [Nitrospirota bacterium]
MLNPTVVCADIGSIAKGNFGWWSSHGGSGKTASSLAAHVGTMLNDGQPVALGFECPLFVPLAVNENELTSARPGEGSYAWSAGAGCGSLAAGLVEVAWVLQEVRGRLTQPVPAFLSWQSFSAAGAGLLVWEAFVSGSAKQANHISDAQAGAEAFVDSLPNPMNANAVVCKSEVYSLVGAALLRTGWSVDLKVLSEPCLVIRAAATAG